MPDVHWGYGFPIGGVAATDVANGGVVSPGGVGFDISCGVRLLAADLDAAELAPVLNRVMDALSAAIPRGVGRPGVWRLHGRAEMEKVLLGGAAYAVKGVTAPGVTWSGARITARSGTPIRLRSARALSTAGCIRSAASARATTFWKSRLWTRFMTR
jgi:RNA-splicing ligase RtcB